MHKPPILSRLRAALDHIYGDRLERVVLYGSRERLRLRDGVCCASPTGNRIARLELRSPASVNGGSAEVSTADRSPGFRNKPVWIA